MKRGDLVNKWVHYVSHSPHGTAVRATRCATAASAISDMSVQAKSNQSLIAHWLGYAAAPHADVSARTATAQAEILKLI